jgi:hypothetical protein
MVRTLTNSTPFSSKLDTKKDIYLTIKGVRVIIELNHHSLKQGLHRNIFESSITHIVKKGFHHILRLQNDERFLMIDRELGITIVGTTYPEGAELVVAVISILNGVEPLNPYHTLTIAV